MARKYGKVVTPSGKVVSEGYDLEQLSEMAKDMDECEQSLYDFVGDIAIEAAILRDLTKHLRETNGS